MLPSTTPPTYALAGQVGHGLSITTHLEQAPPNVLCDRRSIASVQKLFSGSAQTQSAPEIADAPACESRSKP